MRIDIVSLFPEFVDQCAAFGVVGRARERGLLSLHGWNPRDHAEGNYRKVDDRTFGGGPGMVMLVEPLRRCLQAMRQADALQALLARIAELEQASQTFTEQTGNSLAASLGELEDRLERGLPAPRR